jgi:hypothetical protein
MLRGPQTRRHVEPGDAMFALFLVAYAAFSISLIPYDFMDLCYLFSLEQGRWVTQEWVHPIYVPALGLLRGALGLLGYHGPMLVPVELLSVAASTAAFALLYRLARRFPGSASAAAVALGVTALCRGFSYATVRSTPYALALLCQTLSLSLLVSEDPVPARRYARAGALAGLSMGFHAAALALAPVAIVCALFEPDPARTRRLTLMRLFAFGGAMLGVGLACWATFLTYRGIGASYFLHGEFWPTFAGIEQVPGTSIYTSHSMAKQLAEIANTMRFHVGVLFRVAVVLLPLAVALRLWAHAPLTPAERRLGTAAAANFVAIAGFFLINNTHNGFIFASMTLVPVALAVAIRGSWIGLAALVVLAFSGTRDNIIDIATSGAQSAKDPLLAEVRFLQQALGPHDVLLIPGSPFPETLYLSHFNIFEVSAGASSGLGSEVPVLRPGAVLRARIGWWLAHGGRVFYALGDESTEFTGDVSGAQKRHQIFWRPETTVRERAPALRLLRTALEASGLDVHDGPVSPRGQHYAEIRLREAPAAASPPAEAGSRALDELRLLTGAATSGAPPEQLARRVQFLAELEAAIPGDPWRACDVMDLVCEAQPRVDGQVMPCRQLTGCDVPVMHVRMEQGVAP